MPPLPPVMKQARPPTLWISWAPVARNEQVQATLVVELLVPARLVVAVEVRDDDLPVRAGRGQQPLEPSLL
eukprot:15344314-Alexandrium_andersonii.AAC.1